MIGPVAALMLGTAGLTLNGAVPAFLPAAWWYTAGVSLYSTVLVEYPARDGRPGVAAVVFTVAGWLTRDGVDIARFPKIHDHHKRMAERPAVKKVLAAWS